MDKIYISKKELLNLLSIAFDEGLCGYEELKETTINFICNKYIKKNNKDKLNYTCKHVSMPFNVVNLEDGTSVVNNSNNNIWFTTSTTSMSNVSTDIVN